METSNNKIKFVSKGWGHELWIVNKEEYCGKLLYLVKEMFLALSQNKGRSILRTVW